MLRKCAGVLLLILLASCGGSGGGPGSVVAPPSPTDTVAIIVSANPADHPDFLCDGIEDDVEINQAIRTTDSTSAWTVILRPGTYHVLHTVYVLDHVTLKGSGAGTVIRLDDNAPSMLNFAGIIRAKDDTRPADDRRVQHVTIEDFVVDGNRANQSPLAEEKKFGFYAEGDFITMRRPSRRTAPATASTRTPTRTASRPRTCSSRIASRSGTRSMGSRWTCVGTPRSSGTTRTTTTGMGSTWSRARPKC